jgi:hypothetical protein
VGYHSHDAKKYELYLLANRYSKKNVVLYSISIPKPLPKDCKIRTCRSVVLWSSVTPHHIRAASLCKSVPIFKLLLGPVPQLSCKLLVLRQARGSLRSNSNGLVVSTIDHFGLGCGRSPALRKVAFLDRSAVAKTDHQHWQLSQEARAVEQPSEDETRVHRQPGDFRVVASQLVCVKHLSQLRLSIATPFRHHPKRHHPKAGLASLQSFEGDALARCLLVGDRCHVDDADVCVGQLRGGLQERKKQLDKESMTHLVGGELDLIAVHTGRGRSGHDAGVQHQNIEPVRGRSDLAGTFLHGSQRGDVAAYESDLHARIGSADCGSEGFAILLFAAAEDDVRRIVLCEGADRASSETCGALEEGQ